MVFKQKGAPHFRGNKGKIKYRTSEEKVLMDEKTKSMIEIHIAVFLFGIASLFGKLISLPSPIIILGRSIFAIVALFLVIKITKEKFNLETKKEYLILLALGAVLAIHWITFVESVQISSVAVGLLTYSTFPFFVLLIEGIFLKTKITKTEIILAIAVFIGVILILPTYDLSSNLTLGAIYGILSALTFAILAIANRNFVQKYSGSKILFYEIIGSAIFLSPLLFLQEIKIDENNLKLIFIFGALFTATSHTLFIRGMKHISAQKTSIIGTLELIYGIIAAAMIVGEIPQFRTLLGGAIIIVSSAYASALATKEPKLREKEIEFK